MFYVTKVFNLKLSGNYLSCLVAHSYVRTGQTVRLKIIEKDAPPRVNEAVIPGSSCVLDLTKENSKLFLGGVPANFEIQPAVHHQSFDGNIEDFELGGKAVGLWNFVESSNVKGANTRLVIGNYRPVTSSQVI